MGKPLISIVTVCFNDIENLKKTCQSIISQIGVDQVQHIVIDGGSTDGSQDWYRQANLRMNSILVSAPDNGIFDAMNKSISLAVGDYVNFLNAGDVYADVEVLHRVSNQLLRDGPEWSISRARVVDANGNDVRRIVGGHGYSRWNHYYGLGTICHQTVFMKLNFLNELRGFNESYGAASDYHLLLRAGKNVSPHVRNEIDILFEAGGISDVEVYRQLFRRHRARVDAYSLSFFQRGADFSWTTIQVGFVYIKKLFKPLFMRNPVLRRIVFGKG